MPELPEVETVKRIVEPQIAGQKILSVEINNPQIIAHPSPRQFLNGIVGQTVRGMSRRGKFLTIHFESEDRIVLHLRMTGRFLVAPRDFPAEKHTHLTFSLSNGTSARYIDVRRFGRFWLLKKGEADNVSGQHKLGLEPFDKNLTAAFLKSGEGRRTRAVKEMLLDQTVVAGIGNIYSDEILYAAGINPAKRCCDLRPSDWRRLAWQIKHIMAWGIESNATTPEEYLAGKGGEYRNTPLLRIYGREGETCKLCNSVFARTVIGGRGSCYCPHCQK